MPPLTRPFTDTVREQIQESAEFRRGYLREAIACLLSAEIEVSKIIVGDLVRFTVGFSELGMTFGCAADVIEQCLDPRSDLFSKQFFEIVAYLQKQEGTAFELVDHAA